jgi:hypothetical protein
MKYKDVPYFSLLKCYLRSSTHTRNQRKLCIVSYSKGSSIHTQIYEDILSHLTLLYRHGRFSGFLTGNSDVCNTLYEPVKVVYCLILERRTSPITGTLSSSPVSKCTVWECSYINTQCTRTTSKQPLSKCSTTIGRNSWTDWICSRMNPSKCDETLSSVEVDRKNSFILTQMLCFFKKNLFSLKFETVNVSWWDRSRILIRPFTYLFSEKMRPLTYFREWMSFNNHLKNLVWSTRIGRIMSI